MALIQIQTTNGFDNLSVDQGTVVLVVGPNGVGKSALLQAIYRTAGVDYATYYPGHRQITFSHGLDNLQMSFADLRNNLHSQTEAFNRYKSLWPEEQFKHILKRFINAEAAHNLELLERLRAGLAQDEDLHRASSPLQILNHVFEEARMAVRFVLTDDGLSAFREGAIYTVDRLSDGERASLFMAAAIVGHRNAGLILIDEPERHLHPSISSRLISAAVRSSPHLAFVFATHDLNLIETLEVDRIVYLRNSVVISHQPEHRMYNIEKVDGLSELPSDLKREILGARTNILFVEGISTSLDMSLYSLCYPRFKVAPRGGNEKVQEAVKALRDNVSMHWLEVRGLVDGDGRDEHERASLSAQGIEALDSPTIENLFFLPEVIAQVIDLHVGLHGGTADETMAAVAHGIQSSIISDKEEIVARRTTWLANRAVSAQKISVLQSKTVQETVPVNIASIRQRVADDFDDLTANMTINKLEKLPIKATKIPARIASICGSSSLKSYKQTVIRQIELQTTAGKKMHAAILAKLPNFDQAC